VLINRAQKLQIIAFYAFVTSNLTSLRA